jgi:hypothetical protein
MSHPTASEITFRVQGSRLGESSNIRLWIFMRHRVRHKAREGLR